MCFARALMCLVSSGYFKELNFLIKIVFPISHDFIRCSTIVLPSINCPYLAAVLPA